MSYDTPTIRYVVSRIEHGSYTDSIGCRLHATAAELLRLAGWLHFDLPGIQKHSATSSQGSTPPIPPVAPLTMRRRDGSRLVYWLDEAQNIGQIDYCYLGLRDWPRATSDMRKAVRLHQAPTAVRALSDSPCLPTPTPSRASPTTRASSATGRWTPWPP